MNLVWAVLITAAVAALAVTAMLLVRRNAPEGGYFADGDRAAGVFGVLATGFSVLLGFIVFLAFTSYDQSRTCAETEALTVVQQIETAQFFPSSVSGELTGELICYGRSVVNSEWDRMRAGTLGDTLISIFGYPIGHEDDALRSVRATFEARTAVHGLDAEQHRVEGISSRMRAGIEYGEIVVSGHGSTLLDAVTGSVISAAALDGARAGKTLDDVVKDAGVAVTKADVMDGVADLIPMVQIEAVFTDGSRLVTVHTPVR